MAEFSPMMQHYLEIKEQYKDCLVFYRLGDFYEMFFDDAITASKELEITLTGRECGQEEKAPMCGVPFHAAESYIAKLITKGYKVAICEQLEDPKYAKGMVKRDVVRVVTPGTVIEGNLLDEKKNNYIMSIFKTGIYFGIAVCDVTTGEFLASEIKDTNNFPKLIDEIARFMPAEIIVNELLYNSTSEISKIFERFSVYITNENEQEFKNSIDILQKYNIIDDLNKKTEIGSESFAIPAINGLVAYLDQTQKIKLEHIKNIKIYKIQKYMSLDLNARRNLELTEKMRDKSKKGTLLWVLDKTSTSMGGRHLRRWLNDPLVDVFEINRRLKSVSELKEQLILRGDIVSNLKRIYDIERLTGKMSYGNANARDMISLKNSLKQLPELKQLLQTTNSEMLKELYERLDVLQDVFELIDKSIIEDPPLIIKEGGIIKTGYNSDVDRLRKATTEGKNWIIGIENKEREKTRNKKFKSWIYKGVWILY